MANEEIRKKAQSVFVTLDELDLTNEIRDNLYSYIEMLGAHDPATCEHCLRVSVRGVRVAKFLNLDPKPMFYAGLLHDFGKVKVNSEVLNKIKGFSEEDFKEVRKHPLVGYFILRKVFPFSAEVLLRHHRFQENAYPKRLPKSSCCLREQQLIERYARLLALVDFYDALITRPNEFLPQGMPSSRDSTKTYMIQHNPDQKELINQLFLLEIF